MDKRECRVIGVAGKKGVGKTIETIRMIDEYVAGNVAKGRPPRKALIFDVNDEFSDFWYFNNPHRRIPALAIKDLMRFTMHPKIEVRRIRPFFDDGKKMSFDDMADVLGLILDTYRNGLLLCEDINKFSNENMKSDLIGSLSTARHIGVDLICHYQGCGRLATPKLLSNLNMIRLHKTNDSAARHKEKFEEKAEMLQLAESIVNAKYDSGEIRYHLYVDVDNSKIKGVFTEEDISNAIETYLGDNYQKLVGALLNKRSLKTGEKVHTPQSAMQAEFKRLRTTYFDTK